MPEHLMLWVSHWQWHIIGLPIFTCPRI